MRYKQSFGGGGHMAVTSQNTRWGSELGLGHVFPGWAGVERNSRPQEQQREGAGCGPGTERGDPGRESGRILDVWMLGHRIWTLWSFRIFEWSGVMVYILERYISRRVQRRKSVRKTVFWLASIEILCQKNPKGKIESQGLQLDYSIKKKCKRGDWSEAWFCLGGGLPSY